MSRRGRRPGSRPPPGRGATRRGSLSPGSRSPPSGPPGVRSVQTRLGRTSSDPLGSPSLRPRSVRPRRERFVVSVARERGDNEWVKNLRVIGHDLRGNLLRGVPDRLIGIIPRLCAYDDREFVVGIDPDSTTPVVGRRVREVLDKSHRPVPRSRRDGAQDGASPGVLPRTP
jgi:hypothetical protein